MTVTMLKPYAITAYGDLPPHRLFVAIDDGDIRDGLRAYQKLADQPGGEMVKYDHHQAYPLSGNAEMDPEKYFDKFHQFGHETIVLSGPHISSKAPFGGYISPRGEAALRTLVGSGRKMSLDKYYPTGRAAFRRVNGHDDAHSLLGILKDHSVVEIRGSVIYVTLIGLNRALQSEAR